MVGLVVSKNEEDPIKNKGAGVAKNFPDYKYIGKPFGAQAHVTPK